MKLRYILPTALASIMFSTAVFGSGAINVVLNGTPLVFTNPSPAIIDSRTMLPVRGLFDQMGYTIDWDANTKTATLTGEEIVIYATPGSLTAKNRTTMEDIAISSDVSPQIVDGYFMLPLRAIAEATGAQVDWTDSTKTVSISINNTANEVSPQSKGTMSITEDAYLSQTFELVQAIKNECKSTDNAPMMRFFGIGYLTEDAVTPSAQDYTVIQSKLDELSQLTPPSNMDNIQSYVKEFASVVEDAYKLCNSASNGEITADELTKQIDKLKEKKDEIAINHSVVLYQYFCDNNVYFEDVYGENILDILK